MVEVLRNIACLTDRNPFGYRRELNLVSWNGEVPTYDIRSWDESHKSMTRGMTFTKDELMEIVCAMEGEKNEGIY